MKFAKNVTDEVLKRFNIAIFAELRAHINFLAASKAVSLNNNEKKPSRPGSGYCRMGGMPSCCSRNASRSIHCHVWKIYWRLTTKPLYLRVERLGSIG